MNINQKEYINLEELEHAIGEKFKIVSQSKEQGLRHKVAEYLTFLKGQYEMGTLGYIVYPYNIVGLMKIDRVYDEIDDVREIVDIAATLEIPDDAAGIDSNKRSQLTEKMNSLIDKFAQEHCQE